MQPLLALLSSAGEAAVFKNIKWILTEKNQYVNISTEGQITCTEPNMLTYRSSHMQHGNLIWKLILLN